MPQNQHDHDEDHTVQEYFAYLDRREKISDWFLALYLIAILLLTIFGGFVLLS
ncbi:MAG TPA: hypothetical protein VI937_03805 [Negativicutes bacterium]|nr:hypothetical protein [Negativicutes bacterium]